MVLFGEGARDDYLTDDFQIQLIRPFIPPDKIMWDSAYHTESRFPHLIPKCLSLPIDFFTATPRIPWDIQVTNPPFSLKERWLQRSYELGKPFMLLLPADVLHRRYFQNLSFRDELEFLIPPKRVCFVGCLNRPNFESLWVCWKMNLPSQIHFLEVAPL
jgi:hypothetical protein